MRGKNILILGGTSFFGKDIVRDFLADGASVTIFTRGHVPAPELTGVRRVTGDRKSSADLKQLGGESWDVVIDNIAYDATDVQLALDAFPKAKHYILTSTVSVYRYVPSRFPQPLREDAVDFDFKPEGEDLANIHWKYARGKLEAERTVVQGCKIPWTILRPPVVYGPEDPTERGFWYLARLHEGGPILLSDSGVQSFRISYSKDVARVFLEMVRAARKTHGQIYNVAQSEVITLRDFIDLSAEWFKVSPDYVAIPAAELGELSELGGPYAAPIMVNHVPDISKVVRELGHAPTPFEDFIRDTTHWFQNSYRGPYAKLLTSRPRELELVTQWRKALSTR